MAKARKELEVEARALFLTDEQINACTKNTALLKLIKKNQPTEGYMFVQVSQEMIDADQENFKEISVGDVIEVKIEAEELNDSPLEEGGEFKFEVQSNLKRNGVQYSKGKVFKEAFDTQLRELVCSGVLKVVQ